MVPRPLDHSEIDMLAALVFVRFGGDHEEARAAWSRMLENHGWDETEEMRCEWQEMVSRGLRNLRMMGFRYYG